MSALASSRVLFIFLFCFVVSVFFQLSDTNNDFPSVVFRHMNFNLLIGL